MKVESVFGGYLTLLAFYILAVGLITTIIYVRDYHPLMVGEDSTKPSQNSVRTSSVQDYNTQSKASQLANSIKDNITLRLKVVLHNYQAYLKSEDLPLTERGTITNCYDQSGGQCSWSFESFQSEDMHVAWFNITLETIHLTSEALMTIPLTADKDFTFAYVEIEALVLPNGQSFPNFKQSVATYLVLPGENKTLAGTKRHVLSESNNICIGTFSIPIMMTVVVRETELDGDFANNAYMAFTSEELHNMGRSEEVFESTNEPLTFQFRLTLNNNWRLESEQRRVSYIFVTY